MPGPLTTLTVKLNVHHFKVVVLYLMESKLGCLFVATQILSHPYWGSLPTKTCAVEPEVENNLDQNKQREEARRYSSTTYLVLCLKNGLILCQRFSNGKCTLPALFYRPYYFGLAPVSIHPAYTFEADTLFHLKIPKMARFRDSPKRQVVLLPRNPPFTEKMGKSYS